MRYALAAGALIAASISGVVADDGNGCREETGNWYCKAVQKIQYSGLTKAGTYKKVTGMYPSCQMASQSYAGSLAPLNEEVRLSTWASVRSELMDLRCLCISVVP